MGKIIKTLVVLVLIVVAALAALIFTTDVNQYKDKIVEAVRANTGRDFQINGELRLAPSLVPTVAVEGVSLGNAPWAGATPMLSVSRFEAQIALLPLLKKNIEVRRLLLVEPRIQLETDQNGRGNWLLGTGPEATGQTAAPADPVALPALAINEVRIERANIRYVDGRSGKTTKLFIAALTVHSASFLDEIAVTAEAAVNQVPLSLRATLGSLDALLGNRDYPLRLNASLPGAKLALDGQLAKPLAASGLTMRVSLEIDRLSDLNPLAGAALPEAGPIAFNGAISETKSGYAVQPFTARIMDNELTGKAEIDLSGARPALIADLAAGTLDFSPFQGQGRVKAAATDSTGAPAPEAVSVEKVFPSDPLPLAGLKAADVTLQFKTGALITRKLTLNDLNLSLKLDNGKLRIAPFSAKLAGGSLMANIGLDASAGNSALWDHNVELRQIEPGQLPGLREKQLLSDAKTDIDSKGKGAGASVSAIMAGLNGNLLIKTGQGRITARALESDTANALLNTLTLFNPNAGQQDASALECAVINFAIKDGIAVADNGIGIATGKINVLGAGNINLKTEALDLGITPWAKAGAGLSAGQLAGLVRLGGTLAAPRAKTDTEAALTAGIKAGSTVAGGGWSALARGLLGGATGAGQNPCDIALGVTPLQTSPTPRAEQNTPTQKTDAVKEAVEGLGETLKKLF